MLLWLCPLKAVWTEERGGLIVGRERDTQALSQSCISPHKVSGILQAEWFTLSLQCPLGVHRVTALCSVCVCPSVRRCVPWHNSAFRSGKSSLKLQTWWITFRVDFRVLLIVFENSCILGNIILGNNVSHQKWKLWRLSPINHIYELLSSATTKFISGVANDSQIHSS